MTKLKLKLWQNQNSDKTMKFKLWQNLKTVGVTTFHFNSIVTKLKYSNYDKKSRNIKWWQNLQKKILFTKPKNSNSDKTQLKVWQNSKSQIVTQLKKQHNPKLKYHKTQAETVIKLKKSNCDKTLNSNCANTKILKFWQTWQLKFTQYSNSKL